MVSVPGINPDGQSVDVWWPAKVGNVYKYSSGYQSVGTTTPGEGYWMNNDSAQTYNTGDEWPAEGIQKVAHNPISANAGWNMIGGYENSVPVGGITTNPPGLQQGPIYGYSGGYTTPSTMEPGYGYWINLSESGEIILSNTISKSNQIEYLKDDWGKITFMDKSGKSYTLYAVKGDADLIQYELPPIPPLGIFDIRFSSGRIAEELKDEFKSIEMRGMVFPVKVRIENMDLRVQDVTGKEINTNLKSGEEITINNPNVNMLMVSGQLIPDKFMLEQNFPNPFNPTTTIRFAIPVETMVNLSIYNILGERITELKNEIMKPGYYDVKFNPSSFASGIYIYRLNASDFTETKKMIFLK